MTNEQKQLFLRDLCARLPYDTTYADIVWKNGYQAHRAFINTLDIRDLLCDDIKIIKPYLRPMSSMTEKEQEAYCDLQDKFLYSSQYPVTDAYELFDWLNAHHFDYRGLIEKGLALKALEGMYKTE